MSRFAQFFGGGGGGGGQRDRDYIPPHRQQNAAASRSGGRTTGGSSTTGSSRSHASPHSPATPSSNGGARAARGAGEQPQQSRPARKPTSSKWGNISPLSATALDKLEHYSGQLQGLEAQVDIIENTIGDPHIERPRQLEVKDEIAQLNGTLEKLQYVGVDSVVTADLNTGKELAKTNRKVLNHHCDDLRDRILACQTTITKLLRT